MEKFKTCPKCGKGMAKIYGNGFDNDMFYCHDCDHEIILETSTCVYIDGTETEIML